MKKNLKKLTKIILLIFIALTNFITPISCLTENEVKSSASKGDIYNPQQNTLGNSVTITDHNYSDNKTYKSGDVEVKKVVSKVNNE